MTYPSLRIFLAAVLFSTGGAAIKACTLSSWQIAGLRSAVATVVLCLLFPAALRRWNRYTVLVGMAYAGTMILFPLSNKLTTAASSIYIQATAPLYVLLLAPSILHERLVRRDIFFMATLAVGLGLFFIGTEPSTATAPAPLLGNIVSALNGIAWALTILGLRWLSTAAEPGSNPSAPALICGNILAALACAPVTFPLPVAASSDWLWVVYLGVFQIAAAYALLSSGVRHVPALHASLILLMEPVLNPVWAWLVHAEVPSGWALIGGGVIFTATVVHTFGGVKGEG